jgi:hypothetical protein
LAFLVGALPLATLSSLAAVGCRSNDEHVTVIAERGEWRSPAEDGGEACADVRGLYVCWAHGAPSPLTRPLPYAAGANALRCFGKGGARRCVERTRDAPAFVCTEGRCEQRHPRLPDDGEWECADLAGVVMCRGGERAAGVAPAGVDAAFLCGPRAVRGQTGAERLCIDYDPDLPSSGPEESDKYRCHFENARGTVRVCERAPDSHQVSDVCDDARPCVSGLGCAGQRCLPPAPPPNCWLDADCEPGILCRFGSCTKGAP